MIQKIKQNRSLTEYLFPPSADQGVYRGERVDRFARFEKLTRLLDDSFTIPGTSIRVGWDSIIGIVPGLGDMISTVLSGYLIYQAKQLGASNWVLARMVGNTGLDFLLGSIPIAGDIFDVFFKSNRRNSRLLKKHLDRRNAS